MGGVPLRLAGAGPGDRPPGEPRLVGYLYLLPAFAVFFCFVLLPLAHAAYLSLWDWDGLTVGDLGGALATTRTSSATRSCAARSCTRSSC